MDLVIGGLKGGIGKTTTAGYLAAVRARAGRRVAGVDADPLSQSLYDWATLAAERGEDLGWLCLPWAVPDLARRLPGLDAEDVIVDIGGETAGLFRAALAGLVARSRARGGDGAAELLIPCRPNLAELRRIPATLAAAQEVEQFTGGAVYARVLLVAVKSAAADGPAARSFLTDAGVPVMDAQVRDSVAYPRGYGHRVDQVGDYAAVDAELHAVGAST